MSDSRAVAIRNTPVSMTERGLQFQQLDELLRFADGLVTARMAPNNLTAGGIVALVQAGAEAGLPAMWSLQHLTFINGKVGVSGQGALALVRNSGVCRPEGQPTFTFTGKEYTPEWTCHCTTWRKDRDQPIETTFSLADAIQAGLAKIVGGKVQARTREGWGDKGPWATATRDMLEWRAWARMHKREFADVVMGLGVTEELRDYTTERDVSDVTRRVSLSVEPNEPDHRDLAPDPLLTGEVVEDAEEVKDAVPCTCEPNSADPECPSHGVDAERERREQEASDGTGSDEYKEEPEGE